MRLITFGDIEINPEHVVALEAIRVIKPGSPPGLSFTEREEINATRIHTSGGKVFTVADPLAEVSGLLRTP